MWQQVTVEQPDLAQRSTEIMRACVPANQLFSLNKAVAANLSEIKSGRAKMFYYDGGAFELVLKLAEEPKRNRHQVCYGVAGQVEPQTALDLIIDQTRALVETFGLPSVYGCQPKLLSNPLLQQIYDLAAQSPRVQETLLSELGDMWIYRIAYREASVS